MDSQTAGDREGIDFEALDLQAPEAEVVAWRGRRALKLSGLALVPEPAVADAILEVDICAEGPAYPGIAFRAVDAHNFELVYAVPHCSELWDALQYDPVFRGSNTWQLYHGEAFQKAATVPTGEWFHLQVQFRDAEAAVSVDGQPPLLVPCLAHAPAPGKIGVWTYQPAFFSNLRLGPRPTSLLSPADHRVLWPEIVQEWVLQGCGKVACEPHGILNLNRYLEPSAGTARVVRRFNLPEAGEVQLRFGFSDELSLTVDGRVCYTGQNTFQGFGSYADRGYVERDANEVCLSLGSGLHQLCATVKVTEGFGWGLALSIHGEGLRLQPAVQK